MQHSVLVREVQNALNVSVNGFLDEQTSAALKNFQMRAGTKASGLLDSDTIDKLEKLTSFTKPTENIFSEEAAIDATATGTYEKDPYNPYDDYVDLDFSSDLFESNNIGIKEYFLDYDEYVNETTPKKCIFLHHTAGWENPYSTIKWWNKDERGRVGTEFVIGGSNFVTGDKTYDGKILQAFPSGNWAYHLGGYKRHQIKPDLVKGSIGIEICNFGWLKEEFGQFYTYTGKKVPKRYVIELEKPFRGHKYWHNYTDKQIEAVRKLLKHLGSVHQIDISRGLREEMMLTYDKHSAFEYNQNLIDNVLPGIWSHTNVRKDKTDIYPHPKMISMLENLYY